MIDRPPMPLGDEVTRQMIVKNLLKLNSMINEMPDDIQKVQLLLYLQEEVQNVQER